jgi:hypothetical protein
LFFRKKNVINLLTALFALGTFYFLYSAIALISGGSTEQLVDMHISGSTNIIKISSFFCLVYFFVLIFIRVKSSLYKDGNLLLYFFVTGIGVFVGFLINYRNNDWLQIQNILSIEAMLLLIFFAHIEFKNEEFSKEPTLRCIHVTNIILCISLCVSFYEIYFHKAWAVFKNSDGDLVWRASSFLFNPNLYGAWCAILALGFGYLWHAGNNKIAILTGLTLSYIGLYFSGSRSAIYVLVVCLFVAAFLAQEIQWRRRIIPAILMPLSFGAVWLLAKFVSLYSETFAPGFSSIVIIGDRIFGAPLALLGYAFKGITLPSSAIDQVPSEIKVAFWGRFIGNLPDSGIVTLYVDAGSVGLFAAVFLLLAFYFWALRSLMKKRNVETIYALVILIFCTGISISMRYQIFPVWIFFAVIIAPCLAVWRKPSLC